MKDNEIFQELSLDAIFSDRFARYSKYIIQERALPDVRDGLKPVQRRILYAMNKDRNTHDKPYRKSAKTVGNVIGNYHPHGDSSVYSAMVRMSQTWKQRIPLIDMHGNNGSIDGDSAAAMRYTEARLTKVASLLMTDLDKGTVKWAPNFDDTELEPTVLPAQFCNLLVNGATGISSGYACDIPPHNPNEIVDALIHRINNSESTLNDIMKFIKGPDFPTGGFVFDESDIYKAFQDGKGKITIRSKITLIDEKKRFGFYINEIPYEVNKSELVRKIEEIQIDKVIAGIKEVIDETDREGLSILVLLQPGSDRDAILNYLYKYTPLQVSYHYNMVAIHQQRPVLMNLISLLDAYIDFQKQVIYKRSQFELKSLLTRVHLIEGLIKAISIIDEIIALIRSSSNRSQVVSRLQTELEFSLDQANSIADLRLYRLTSTDVMQLKNEHSDLTARILVVQEIINDSNALKKQLIKELKQFNNQFTFERKTNILSKVKELVVDKMSVVEDEDVVVTLTKSGYVKRVSSKSFNSSTFENYGRKANDLLVICKQSTNKQHLLIFFSTGKYATIPIFDIAESKWRDNGEHISFIAGYESNESIVSAFTIDLDEKCEYLLTTRQGQIMRLEQTDLSKSRFKRMYSAIQLKQDDSLVSVNELSHEKSCIIITHHGYGLHLNIDDVSSFKPKSKGVKGINLGKEDYVITSLCSLTSDFIIINQLGQAKRVSFNEITFLNRATKGIPLFKALKTKKEFIEYASLYADNVKIIYITDDQLNYLTNWPKIVRSKTSDRFSNFLSTFNDIMILTDNNLDSTNSQKSNSHQALADLLYDEKDEITLLPLDELSE